MAARKKVLFICVHNRARSQIAEGLCKQLLAHQYKAFSAGSEPAESVHPMAVACLAEIGIDISENRPKQISDFNLEEFDLIISLCAEEQCPVLPAGVEKKSWNLEDPSTVETATPEDQLRRFRKCRDDIKRLIQSLHEVQCW